MAAIPRWARDPDSATRMEEIAGDKMMADVRRERLQTRNVASLPAPEHAYRELANEERALRLPTRGGRRWKAIGDLDQRVQALQHRQENLRTEAAGVRDSLPAAESADMGRLAAWHERGQQDERPAPKKEELERQLERIDADVRAIDRLIDSALSEKTSHVEKHRNKLTREAAVQPAASPYT